MKLFEFWYEPQIDGAQIIFYEGFSRIPNRTRLDCIQDAIGELNELYRGVENECVQEITRRKNEAAINTAKEIGEE
jgi:hypothetical protein